jgi:hypothetical protein
MRRKIELIAIVLGVSLAVSSSVFTNAAKQQAARSGVQTAVAQLPRPKDYQWIKEVYNDIPNPIRNGQCYYSRAYVILGTALPVTLALDTYIGYLQSFGWILSKEEYTTPKVLYHGVNELAVVDSSDPGPDVAGKIDYAQLQRQYPTVLYVRIDYALPSRNEC